MNAASAYLREYGLLGKKWRYDSISIVGTPETFHTVEHHENIANVLDRIAYSQQKRYNKQRPGTWGTSKWRKW
jgi:hypothetical protein